MAAYRSRAKSMKSSGITRKRTTVTGSSKPNAGSSRANPSARARLRANRRAAFKRGSH